MPFRKWYLFARSPILLHDSRAFASGEADKSGGAASWMLGTFRIGKEHSALSAGMIILTTAILQLLSDASYSSLRSLLSSKRLLIQTKGPSLASSIVWVLFFVAVPR